MSAHNDSTQDQIAQLQSQVAFQEDAVQALDKALASQQQEILLLRRQIELLQQRIQEQAAGQDSDHTTPANDRPPHY